MKKFEENKASFLWWSVAGSLLLMMGVVGLTLQVDRILSFTLLGLSFVLNLIAVLKAMARGGASAEDNTESQNS